MKKILLLIMIFLPVFIYSQQNYNELNGTITKYNQQHESEYNRLMSLFETHHNDNRYMMHQKRIEGIHRDILEAQRNIENLINSRLTRQVMEQAFAKLDSLQRSFKRAEDEFTAWQQSLNQ